MKLQHIITKISTVVALTISLLALPTCLLGETAMKIGNYSGCSNSEILIPVEIENFVDIAAFTIYIGVNSNNIELVGFENLHEGLSTGNFVGAENIHNGYITFNWASLTGMSVENGVLCDVRVLLKGNTEEFNFLESCEIARTNLSIIDDVKYSNGSLISLSSVTPDPITQSLVENSAANIELVGLSSEVTCNWQQNDGQGWFDLNENSPFEGVNSTKLIITEVSTSMNGNLYRGMLSNGYCSEGSSTSELFVITSGIGDYDQTEEESYINIYPNPAHEYLNCIFNQNIQDASLIMISLNGNVVKKNKIGSVITGQLFSLNLENITSGSYILSLFNNDQLLSNLKVIVQ
ncbi:MAG: T9SS type A sorting domain-containing protein [Bacteroidetes bacterium]|nr:T9SS type A sorting domain-containing protein [Bacteroidota bacterium]